METGREEPAREILKDTTEKKKKKKKKQQAIKWMFERMVVIIGTEVFEKSFKVTGLSPSPL